MKRDLDKRLLSFGANILQLVNKFPQTSSGKHIAGQLLRSATSIGANYQEGQAAESKRDFIHKLQLSLKETRETCYWLELLVQSKIFKSKALDDMLDESFQLRAILSKAVFTAKQNNKN